jgi:hypothetical protein
MGRTRGDAGKEKAPCSSVSLSILKSYRRQTADSDVSRRGLKFIGSSLAKHPSKILLEFLCPGGRHLACYRRYLQNTHNFSVSHRSVSLLEDDQLQKFYCHKRPEIGPKYLNFFDDCDLAKLEPYVGSRIVVLLRRKKFGYQKIHDRRAFQDLLGHDKLPVSFFILEAMVAVEEDADESNCNLDDDVIEEGEYQRILASKKRIVGTCNNKKNKKSHRSVSRKKLAWSLYACPKNFSYIVNESEKQFAAGRMYSFGQTLENFTGFLGYHGGLPSGGCCLVTAILGALGLSHSVAGLTHSSHSEFCLDSSKFVLDPDAAFAAVQADFVLVTHLKSAPPAGTTLRDRTCPSAQLFGVLCVVRRSSSENNRSIEGFSVVSLTIDRLAYKLKDNYAAYVLKGAPSRRRRPPANTKYPSPAHKLPVIASSAGYSKAAAKMLSIKHDVVSEPNPLRKKVAAASSVSGEDADAAASDLDLPCRFCYRRGCCTACTEFEKYAPNLSEVGPQFLYKQQISSYDLLKQLGMLNDHTRDIITRLCNLSVSSFDVESAAIPVETSGEEDLTNLAMVAGTVSSMKFSRVVHSVQRPVRIGFQDFLMLENDEPAAICRVETGENGDVLVERFVDLVMEKRDEAVVAKYELVSDLLAWIGFYKRMHYAFAVSSGGLPLKALLDEEYISSVQAGGGRLCGGGDGDDDDEEEEEDDDDDLGSAGGLDDMDLEVLNGLAKKLDDEDARLMPPPPPPSPSLNTSARLSGTSVTDKILARKEARVLADRRSAWRNSPHGMLETRLLYLTHSYHVFGFNAEGLCYLYFLLRNLALMILSVRL